MESREWTVRIHRRPWYEWVLWAIWLGLAAFLANLWLASAAELEPQASTMGWISLLFVAAVGVVVYVWERLVWRREAA